MEYQGRGWEGDVKKDEEDEEKVEIKLKGDLIDCFESKKIHSYLTVDLESNRDVLIVFLDGGEKRER